MSTVLLIRHGESVANRGEATSCPCKVEITSKGARQTEAIARFLQEAQLIPELIITSSYLRAKQTAEATKLAFPEVLVREWPVQEFTYLPSLHEIPSTKAQRQPLVDDFWKRSDPSFLETPTSSLSYVDAPQSGSAGPESFEQFIERVRGVKKRLEGSDLAIIALFSHEQFINAFQWLSQYESQHESQQLSSQAMKAFRSFLDENPIQNGAIVTAKFHRRYAQWHYETITSHLNEGQYVLVKK
jgi:probable phosphoglycerate mutase